MAKRPWISKLRCPKCKASRFSPQPAPKGKEGGYGAWGVKGIRCLKCKEGYAVEKPGILRLIPRGDYSRYAYWEKMHSKTRPGDIAALYKRRFSYPEKFLLNYYAMPRLALKMGLKAKDSLELGAQWGSNSLSLHKFGVTRQAWLLDISVTALKGAIAFFGEFGLKPFALQGEIHGLPFKDKAFDLTLSGGLYEHFVGKEQEELVRENVRISKKLLCQVPESSLAYWIYRNIVSALNGFKWPFGFEVPLKWRRLKALYEGGGARTIGRDWHNLASAILMVLGEKFEAVRALNFRPFFFYLFRHDAVIAAENTGRKHG